MFYNSIKRNFENPLRKNFEIYLYVKHFNSIK